MLIHPWRIRLVGAASLAIVAGTLSLAQPPRERGTKYAFLVACADYDVNHLRKLPYTILEMEEFRDVLVQSGFPNGNIKFLNDNQKERRFVPLRSNIVKELELLLARVEADDTLVVAINGHGVQGSLPFKKGESIN